MEQINLQRLWLEQQAARPHLDESQSSNVSDSGTGAKPPAQVWSAFLHDHQLEGVTLTNRNQPSAKDGSFVLIFGESEVKLLVSTSVKKTTYLWNLSDNELQVNNKSVDRSFIQSFLRKVEHIMGLFKQDKIEAIGQKVSA